MSAYVTVSELFASDLEGDPMLKVGAVLSSVKVLEGPAAAVEFPAASAAVADAIEIPIVPSPEQLESVTVLVAVPAPDTAAVHVAVPVALTEISPLARVTDEAPV